MHSIRRQPQRKCLFTEPWQHEFVSHAPEYGAEFIGTAFLMFCVVGAVAFMFAPQSPAVRLIAPMGLRLFLTGLVLGGVGSFVAITPIGRLSGAHLNPAISLGFFALGRMHLQDLLSYVVAQLSGALLGAWTGRVVFGNLARGVHDALNQPGNQVSACMALAGEFAATFVLAVVVFVMISRRRLMRWTPLAVVGVVAILVGLDGNFSGASLNPARSFGPVIVTADWHLYWIYVAGPCAGSMAAGLLQRFGTQWEAETGKLFHDLHYRSIFKGPSDHAANEHVRRQAAAEPGSRPPLHRPANGDVDGESRAA